MKKSILTAGFCPALIRGRAKRVRNTAMSDKASSFLQRPLSDLSIHENFSWERQRLKVKLL